MTPPVDPRNRVVFVGLNTASAKQEARALERQAGAGNVTRIGGAAVLSEQDVRDRVGALGLPRARTDAIVGAILHPSVKDHTRDELVQLDLGLNAASADAGTSGPRSDGGRVDGGRVRGTGSHVVGVRAGCRRDSRSMSRAVWPDGMVIRVEWYRLAFAAAGGSQ